MPDVFTKAKRSEVMSRIRGRGNKKTELLLVRLFRVEGITGWRRHSALIGRPDFAFCKHRLVVFVDGCFWHCCPKHATAPKNNADFWRKKLDGNVARDRMVNRTLRKAGWRIVRIWEHDLPKRGDYWARRIGRLLSES
jgi:DNA mismatch endonuclease, patch repair protein